MLVISSKVSEPIQIGDNIIIKVVAIVGGAVRIGIDAPRDVKILREQIAAVSEKSRPVKQPSEPEVIYKRR